jgi:hypothetical protein
MGIYNLYANLIFGFCAFHLLLLISFFKFQDIKEMIFKDIVAKGKEATLPAYEQVQVHYLQADRHLE